MQSNEKPNNKRADILNIEVSAEENKTIQKVEQPTEVVAATNKIQATADSHIDYNMVRQNLKKLITTSEIAIEGILNVADEGDSPRAYEVVSDLIKTALDANNRLIELHKTVKDINKQEGTQTKGDTVTNNSIFVGNTTDLLKMLKQKKLPVVDAEKITTEDAKDSK
jgi:aspartyl/asparaginyl-tRNA synthetase